MTHEVKFICYFVPKHQLTCAFLQFRLCYVVTASNPPWAILIYKFLN